MHIRIIRIKHGVSAYKQSLKVGPGTSLRFKIWTPGPPLKV